MGRASPTTVVGSQWHPPWVPYPSQDGSRGRHRAHTRAWSRDQRSRPTTSAPLTVDAVVAPRRRIRRFASVLVLSYQVNGGTSGSVRARTTVVRKLTEKSVIRAPFRPLLNPGWYVLHLTANRLARGLSRFDASPLLSALPRLPSRSRFAGKSARAKASSWPQTGRRNAATATTTPMARLASMIALALARSAASAIGSITSSVLPSSPKLKIPREPNPAQNLSRAWR